MVVVDASVLVDALLIGTERVAVRIAGVELHAPATVDAEFLHATRKRWLARVVDEQRAQSAFALFHGIVIIRHSVTPLMSRMWALRHNVSSYDASYVALAESLRLPLLTRDRRLSQSSGHGAAIEYIA